MGLTRAGLNMAKNIIVARQAADLTDASQTFGNTLRAAPSSAVTNPAWQATLPRPPNPASSPRAPHTLHTVCGRAVTLTLPDRRVGVNGCGAVEEDVVARGARPRSGTLRGVGHLRLQRLSKADAPHQRAPGVSSASASSMEMRRLPWCRWRMARCVSQRATRVPSGRRWSAVQSPSARHGIACVGWA